MSVQLKSFREVSPRGSTLTSNPHVQSTVVHWSMTDATAAVRLVPGNVVDFEIHGCGIVFLQELFCGLMCLGIVAVHGYRGCCTLKGAVHPKTWAMPRHGPDVRPDGAGLLSWEQRGWLRFKAKTFTVTLMTHLAVTGRRAPLSLTQRIQDDATLVVCPAPFTKSLQKRFTQQHQHIFHFPARDCPAGNLKHTVNF